MSSSTVASIQNNNNDDLFEEKQQPSMLRRESSLTSSSAAMGGRKRIRSGGCSTMIRIPSPTSDTPTETPTLILPRSPPAKKPCLEHFDRSPNDPASVDGKDSSNMLVVDTQSSDLLRVVPEDVLGHVLGFLSGSVSDWYSVQCSCRTLRRLSQADTMLQTLRLGGEPETGKSGIFCDSDSVEDAVRKVSAFARAGNLEALYLLGMLKTYCQPDVEGGILILKRAASEGFVRAHYTLGLVLRDSHSEEAAVHLQTAANAQYLPALQEVLPNRELKAKYGELTATQLRPYLDPIGLNRLLGRHYIHSTVLRDLNTSHCWNPLCGRWAFKAQMVPPSFTEASFHMDLRVSRMKMCSRCCRAKYCSKLCQVYDWRSGRHKTECQFLN